MFLELGACVHVKCFNLSAVRTFGSKVKYRGNRHKGQRAGHIYP